MENLRVSAAMPKRALPGTRAGIPATVRRTAGRGVQIRLIYTEIPADGPDVIRPGSIGENNTGGPSSPVAGTDGPHAPGTGRALQRGGAGSGQQCSASGVGERLVNPGPQGGQGCGACLPGGHLSAAQDQQGRDGLGPEPPRDLRCGVDVHLDQLDLAR